MSDPRLDILATRLDELTLERVAEIGVWKGQFAASFLKAYPTILTYYMVDPWQHLPTWQKPANVDNEEFDRVYQETMAVT